MAFNRNPRDLHENNRNWQRIGDILDAGTSPLVHCDNSNGTSNSAENSTSVYTYTAAHVIASSDFVAQEGFRLTMRGVFTTENPAPNGRLKVYLGGALIADSGSYAGLPDGAFTEHSWKSVVEFTFRNTISISVGGETLFDGVTLMFPMTVVSVNATDGNLTATWQWAGLGAANRFTLRSYVLERL